MKTKSASTKNYRDETSILEMKLLLAKAGYTTFRAVCKELGLHYHNANVAIYRGARRGKQGAYRKTILTHLCAKAAQKGTL